MFSKTVSLSALLVLFSVGCADSSPLEPRLDSPTFVSSATGALLTPALSLTSGETGTLTFANLGNLRRSSSATYSSSNSSVVTIGSTSSTTATVTGRTAGVAWIRRIAPSAKDSLLVSVVALPTLAITPDSLSTTVGTTVTFTSNATTTPTWSSDAPTVASIDATGRATGVSSGRVLVRVSTADGRTASAVLVVEAPVTTTVTPSSTSSTELPVAIDSVLTSARSALAVRTIRPVSGASLQAALDSARGGDQILLDPSVQYVGNFVLRRKTGSAWITLRTAADNALLPASGVRVTPAYAPSLGKLVAQDPTVPVLRTEAGASNYRLLGLELTVAPTATTGYSLVMFGWYDTTQTGANQPARIVLERSYLHGTPTFSFQRCLSLNSGSTVVVDSWLSECHGKGFDSQAILGYNGTGPYLIQNNHLEGAGENVMFGGADPVVAGQLPSDITLRGNHLVKPLAWQGVWTVKNLLEFKLGRRVLVEGNVLENSWPDGQTGYAVLLKSVNQNGSAPWSETAHVTVRYNIIRNVACGMNLAARPEAQPAVPMHHISILHNAFEQVTVGGCGKVLEVSNVHDLTIAHNAGVSYNYGVSIYGGDKMQRFVLTNNIFGVTAARYDVWDWALASVDGGGYGTSALDTHTAPGYDVRGNAFVGVRAALFPAGNSSLGGTSAGFVSFPSNLRLTSTSPLTGTGVGGVSPGPQWTTLASLTSGVVIN